MEIVNVVLRHDEFRADDANGVASATQNYYVEADEPIGSIEALSASFGGVTIPGPGAVYSPLRPFCRVITRRVTFVSPRQREIDVDYSDPTNGLGLFPADLLNQPARISTQSGRSMAEYFIDRSDPKKFIRNAAGEPFDRGPERLEDSLAFSIRKFVNVTTFRAILNALHTTNESPKTIRGILFDADELLIADAISNPVEGAAGVEEAAIAIEFKPGGWIDEAMNVGYTALSETLPPTREAITERLKVKSDPETFEDVPVTKPWPLLENGSKQLNPSAAPHVLKFRPYYANAWSGVPLA